uniref:Translation initiation factor IF-2, chloroplastic n=2 Tax=Tetradesmus obliquus TaxID=3088 RepID=A0A383VHM0_TETOB
MLFSSPQSLLELNLVPEEWGGNTPMVPISAKKGTGIDDLLQAVAWVAEEKQLMANATKLAAGTVIEAHLDKKRGAVATLLVQAGTLRTGDIVSCGACCGKVRSLTNSAGRPVGEAGPSIAVQLIGLNAVPNAGDEFQAHTNDGDARKAADAAGEGLRAARIAEMSTTGSMVTLSSLATFDEDTDTLQRMNLIIKGDTSGVVEAIKGALQGLPQESVVLRYLLCAAGDITTSDVDLAAASSGMVVGFNLNPDEAVLSHAKRLGVTINTYKVIYNLIDDVKAAMEGKLRTIEERQPLGTATVKAVFGSGKKKVAGVVVDEGKLQKGAQMEVTRGKDTIVYTGKVASLRRIKDNVEEVQVGLECGVGADEWTSWQEGDVIKCYLVVTKSQRLEEARAATAVDVNSLSDRGRRRRPAQQQQRTSTRCEQQQQQYRNGSSSSRSGRQLAAISSCGCRRQQLHQQQLSQPAAGLSCKLQHCMAPAAAAAAVVRGAAAAAALCVAAGQWRPQPAAAAAAAAAAAGGGWCSWQVVMQHTAAAYEAF